MFVVVFTVNKMLLRSCYGKHTIHNPSQQEKKTPSYRFIKRLIKLYLRYAYIIFVLYLLWFFYRMHCMCHVTMRYNKTASDWCHQSILEIVSPQSITTSIQVTLWKIHKLTAHEAWQELYINNHFDITQLD